MAAKEKQKGKSLLSLLLRVAIAVFACWFIFKDFDIVKMGDLDIPTLLLAIGIFSGGICLIGVRWWVFLRAQKIEVPLFLAVQLTFLGQFFTNFMPSAVGGDIVRGWYISRHTHKKLQAVLGIVADRMVGLISTFILAISSYFLFFKGRVNPFQIIKKEEEGISTFFDNNPISPMHLLLVGIILVGFGCLLSGLFDFKETFRKSFRYLVHFLRQFKEVFKVYARHPLVLILGLGLTLFLQSMVIFSLWLIGRGLGMSSPIQFYFVFFPMMWVISSLPLSIAGLGILEGGIVLLFVQFTGAEEDAAKALALCQRLTWVVASIPGLIIHLTGSHRVILPPPE